MKRSARQPDDAEFVPATQDALCRFVAQNAAETRQPLVPTGGGTALDYGYPLERPGATVALSQLTRIIDYPARDMTITVEAGIRMDELTRILAAEGQRLPVDAPQSDRATLGGVVATNTAGPRRFGFGTIRDYVIGLSAVDARGRLFHSGGRVVKNVAGYDLCKLLVGSLGTLAIITQLTLKLKPLAVRSAHVWTSFDSYSAIDTALESLLTSNTRPVSLEVLDPRAAAIVAARAGIDVPAGNPVLCIGVEGSEREVGWQMETLVRELSASGSLQTDIVKESDGDALRSALTEFQADHETPLTFQANLLPSKTMPFVERAVAQEVAVQAHAGNGIVIGHLPQHADTDTRAEAILQPLRSSTRECHGNLIVLACEPAWKSAIPIFGHPEPSWPLMRKVKAALDPDNLLNPGRFIDRL